jgi:hypothetical protein
MRKSFKNISKIAIIVIISLLFVSYPAKFSAQLESDNYKILDSQVDSGGGAGDSASGNYSLLQSFGNPTADSRLTSGSYAMGAGFPNGIIANVPKILCAETDTTTGGTCYFPNSYGAQGECGSPGCADRAKVEIDPQENPIDTLYLVIIEDTDTSTTYYVQSDLSISTTYDINDYMTKCTFEGRDTRDASCDDSSSTAIAKQRYNILGLRPGVTYNVSSRALSGDFTETQIGPSSSFTTEHVTLILDIDIGTVSTVENDPVYQVDLGVLPISSGVTATDTIWLDMGTNNPGGLNVYTKDLYDGLKNTASATVIPSEAEDVYTDPNSNGGFGLKTSYANQTRLGPLQKAALYDTAGANEVGNLSSTLEQLIFYTSSTASSDGQITEGRGGLTVKAKTPASIEGGDYEDTIIFTMTTNL